MTTQNQDPARISCRNQCQGGVIGEFRPQRRGAAIVVVLVCLVAMFGIAGLVIDGGRIMSERRRAQNTADAAALAAAIDLYQGQSSETARLTALLYAARNGYNNDGASNTVTVNIPPLSGAYAGNPMFVEVQPRRKLPIYFAFLMHSSDVVPTARSVAGYGKTNPLKPGLILLHPTKDESLIVRKGMDFSVVDGEIQVNSSSQLKAAIVKDGATVSATKIQVTGGYTEAKLGDFSPNPVTGVAPIADPLALLPPPSTTGLPVFSKVTYTSKTPLTLSPGVYNGGIEIKGEANVTLQPGIYILKGGGFQIETSGSVTGNEIMIYNTNGPSNGFEKIRLKVAGNLTITPPTSGDYEGITIFNDRANAKEIKIESKSTDQTISGTIYGKSSKVHIHGKGIFDGTQIVSSRGRFCTDGQITLRYDPGSTARPRFLSLVE